MGYRRGDFSSLLVRSSLPPSHSETPDTQAITREAKNVTYNQGLIQLPFKKKAHDHPCGFACPILQKNNLAKLKVSPLSVCRVTLRPCVKKKRTLCPIKPPSEFDKGRVSKQKHPHTKSRW